MQFKLRPYQEEGVAAGVKSLKEKSNGIIVAPTASGKSLYISNIVREMGGRSIVLQPSKEILEQNVNKIISYGERDIGIYSASMGSKNIGKITFATIGSIHKKKELFRNFDNILVDEAHLCNSKGGMYEDFINSLGIPVLGLTATPFRFRSRRDVFGNPISESKILTRTRPRIFKKISHITQVSELYQQGFLCPLDYQINPDYAQGDIKSNTTGAGFNEDALIKYNAAKKIIRKAVDAICESKAKHILVFNQFRHESQEILSILSSMGIRAYTVSSETKQRDREFILNAFLRGDIRVVINVGVLTTGFDFPELDEIILARPTKSVALYYQIMGRPLRIHPEKEKANIVDLCGNVRRFGRLENFEIRDINGNGNWRLFSEVGPLTGVDVNTGSELEKTVSKPSSKKTLSFGKHKGKRLSEVPKDYLEWGVKNFENQEWKKVFQKELDLR